MSTEPNNRSNVRRALVIALLAIVVLIIGWHIIFPLLGIAVVMTGSVWGIVVASIALLCMGVLLLFVLPGMLILLVAAIAFIWVVIAIILAPFAFPLLVPLLVILWFVAYLRRRKD